MKSSKVMLPTTQSRPSPYVEMSRESWAELANSTNVQLDQESIDSLRGFDDPTNVHDLREVYLPLTQLLALYMRNTGRLYSESNEFLGLSVDRTPFVIGIGGSVAVGKSTVARLLRELLAHSAGFPQVELITTDGFLWPNAVLQERGLMEQKGFPASYNRRALMQFVMDVKSGVPDVEAPVYSHVLYDIVPNERVVVHQPDILIVEGLNVLQPARKHSDGTTSLAVSDFFDFSVYVDADEQIIRQWYINRFLSLRTTAFRDPDSYFSRYAHLDDSSAIDTAERIWAEINGPNLRQNIAPTKQRATAILRKGPCHEIKSVQIRKI